jgi:hypothetical protein
MNSTILFLVPRSVSTPGRFYSGANHPWPTLTCLRLPHILSSFLPSFNLQTRLPSLTTRYAPSKSSRCRLPLFTAAPATPRTPTLPRIPIPSYTKTKRLSQIPKTSSCNLKTLSHTSQTLFPTSQIHSPLPCYTKILGPKCLPEIALEDATFISSMHAIETLQLVA